MVGLRSSIPWSEREVGAPSHTLKLPRISLHDIDRNGIAWRLRCIYAETLKRLMSFDKERFFSRPAYPCTLPEYNRRVKKAMDFKIMWEKVDNMMYLDDPSLFDEDISLVVENMKTYNPPTSATYQAGCALERLYEVIRPYMIRTISKTIEEAAKNNNHAPRDHIDASTEGGLEATSSDLPPRCNLSDPTSAFKCRKKRVYPFRNHEYEDAVVRPPRNINPIIYAVNQSVMGDNIAWEHTGLCMSSPGGLNRIISLIESVKAKLQLSPYAQMSWFAEFIEPHNRILKEFEYRKHSADMRNSDCMDPHALSVLMGRLRAENYKDSIYTFVGSSNIKRINNLFPSLMDTLKDLQINPHLVLTSKELKF